MGSSEPDGNYHDADDQENFDDTNGASDQEDDVDNSDHIYVVNTILNGTTRLNVLPPMATILAFSICA